MLTAACPGAGRRAGRWPRGGSRSQDSPSSGQRATGWGLDQSRKTQREAKTEGVREEEQRHRDGHGDTCRQRQKQRPRDSEMGTDKQRQTGRQKKGRLRERQGGGTERQTEMETEKEMARETGQLRQWTE